MELKFTWKIDNFTKLGATELYSKIFSVECSKWRVLIYPNRNRDEINKSLSIYLVVAGSSSLPIGWNRSCKFRLSVVDQKDAKYTITKESDHKFNAGESSWGFPSFMSLSDLHHHPSRGYIMNDTCIIEAEVDIHKVIEEVKEGTDKAEDQPSIDVKWANVTAGAMMSAALNNLSDDHLSYQGFSAKIKVLVKGFISLGASQRLFEEAWRPWIDNILQYLKELDNMEEALKMDSVEAAIKESLLKINESCRLHEDSYTKLKELDEQAATVCQENYVVVNKAKLTKLKAKPPMYETIAEQYEKELAVKEPVFKKQCAGLLSAKSTLEGLKAQKAKMEGQLEGIHDQVVDRRKLLIEKKAEIRLRMQIHPTQQDRSTP